MVLPATEMGLRQQRRRLNKMHRKASTMDDDIRIAEAKEEARRAAKEVLENLLSSGTNNVATDRRTQKMRKKKKNKANEDDHQSGADSSNASASSNDSVLSAEIAIQRGSMRALSEANERGDDSSILLSHSGGFDFTTITEAETDEQSNKKRGKKKTKRKSRDLLKKFAKKCSAGKVNIQRAAAPLLTARAGIRKECWMCGCCGKVFATYEIADNHERKCLQTIIAGFDQKSRTVNDHGDNAYEEESIQPNVQNDEQDYDSKPPAKPLGVPKEVLQRTKSCASVHQQQESMIPDFAAARDVFLSEREASTAITPVKANDMKNGNLTLKTGREDPPTRPSLSTTSIFASARSMHSGMESTKKGSHHPSAMGFDDREDRSNNVTSPNISQLQVSFQGDDPSKMQSLSSPTPMDLQSPALAPSRRLSATFKRNVPASIDTDESLDILLTRNMRHQIIMTDEALVNSVQRASEIILTADEVDAEKDLNYISGDKQYYDDMVMRASKFKAHPMSKFRTDGNNVVSKIQNKFVDAWQLIKDGDNETEIFRDQYEKKNRGNDGANKELEHDANTHYVNVVVRHSVKVVSNEIERLAGKRWKDQGSVDGEKLNDNFEQFRKFAHVNLIKLAKLALSVDFTPRKVSVQLSNDLYRLMAPQLKRRGVIIETEIEYRVGPYFVLAVNVKSIQWSKLIKYSHRVVTKRYRQWEADQARRDELQKELAIEEGLPTKGQVNNGGVRGFFAVLGRVFMLTRIECLSLFLSWMYCVHWTISTPLCIILYKFFLRSTVRKYILTSVADEIFSYVEEKGMEMEIGIVEAEKQAAFMLSALREVREGSKALKKQKGEPGNEGVIVGPLLGPAIKSDKEAAPPPPPDFEMPENLDMVNFECDLPVGFKRLRWAMLSSKSHFNMDAIFAESKYENIILQDWTRHQDTLGAPILPADVKEEDFVGAERECQYLMPKSGFVGANTAYDTNIITAYNDYCFSVKKRTLSPEVPYGSTFVTWTQMIFTNTGNDSCHVVCSVEAEFPNGPPMISGQIKSGMRAGTALSFVLMGEIIIKYADQFP